MRFSYLVFRKKKNRGSVFSGEWNEALALNATTPQRDGEKGFHAKAKALRE